MLIRKATKGDGNQLVELFNTLDTETSFMMMEPGERNTSEQEQENHIKEFANSTSKTMLVAFDDKREEIIGFIVGIGGTFLRNRHALYCVIGVKQCSSGQGIGKKLLTNLEQWAVENHFCRLELTVMKHNTRAIHLYRSCGFEQEGVKRHSLRISDKFVDELYMSKLLPAQEFDALSRNGTSAAS